MAFVFSKQGDTIKIGLLIPDKENLAAKHGAELAIRKANEKGGCSGSGKRSCCRDAYFLC